MNTDPLILATCRAEPNSADPHNHVPLPAGEYRLLVVGHRREPSPAARHCQTCTVGSPYVTQHHLPDLPDGDVIVVVHGFNCTQQSGIETTFNVRDALAVWGVPIAAPAAADAPPQASDQLRVMGFTWPCEHTLFPGYMADKEAVARFAAFSLANLITDLHRAAPTRRIHMIAHSMGCFLTLKALNMLAVLHVTQGAAVEAILTTVTWLAPDINADALERSTPASLRVRAWRHPARFLVAQRMAQRFARPKREDEPAVAMPAAHPDAAHPLDGYGYAALDVVRQLHIYSSLRDEALWASPLANHVTEESGSASGAIRLGWCGPLHPHLMMVPDGHQNHRAREVALIDCTSIISEHGGYFFDAAVGRDLAARLAHAQGHTSPAPPAARQPLARWHAGSPLQYPLGEEALPRGLTLWQLVAPTDHTESPHPDAPAAAAGSITVIFANLWQNRLTSAILALWIRLLRAYYRV
ncbi:MAG: alpha/beta hydrolase [Ktedonobacterales bacterium]|nr:alpha/beta hydrolase [Ktedonobacterales bacterium]